MENKTDERPELTVERIDLEIAMWEKQARDARAFERSANEQKLRAEGAASVLRAVKASFSLSESKDDGKAQ